MGKKFFNPEVQGTLFEYKLMSAVQLVYPGH